MRTYDHNLLRFKLLMGMLVWSHKEAGIRFHNNLPRLDLIPVRGQLGHRFVLLPVLFRVFNRKKSWISYHA